MSTTSTQTASIGSLYKGRKGTVDIVDVPALSFLVIDGQGDPGADEFGDAVQALYSVSYGAHFLLKQQFGGSTHVMPLEALWWVDDPAQQHLLAQVALGGATMADTDRDLWRWQAMIMQPEPIDEDTVSRAVERVRNKHLPALDRIRFVTWGEGRCAQTLHVGPYATEGPAIALLHTEIAAAGYRPRGRHHEIYLGDPRRSAPDRLRTILRHPVELI